jgi:ATP sulfurylase
VVDASYELPLAYKVTKASASDTKAGPALLKQMEGRPPGILGMAETLAADKGYDDSKLIKKCWDQYQTGNRHTPPVERWGRRTLT